MKSLKSRLYKEIGNCSLSDYCIFNQSKKDIEKNSFLKHLLKVLNKEEWFDLSAFKELGERPRDKGVTQIAFADSATKKEEFDAISNVFNEEEIELLIHIIKELKSFGVLPIKELMDDHDEANKKSPFMKSAFFTPFRMFRRKSLGD